MTSTPRRSRRSHPNLTHLSLAPLSSKYPLDASTPPSPSSPTAQTPSYIANRSAPTTPGILSLSQSRSTSATRSRRRPKTPTAAFAHDGYFPATPTETPQRAVGEIPKAKSTSVLVPGLSSITTPATLAIAGEGKKRHHLRTRTGGDFRLPTPLQRHHTTHEAADEWLHRAGLAIAGETRESKGQSWLVRRASSTSLVRQSDGWDEHPSHEHEGVQLMKLLSGEHFEGGEAGWVSSPRVVEADFVGSDEESVGDEEEVARLARERGFGLGGWMDRLMGWTLFSVEEDGESSDEEGEEEEEALTREEVLLKKEVEAKRRKMERETIIAASAAGSKGKEVENENDVPIPELVPAEGEGGWQDAAWLLSVASKVLL
ncbi:hypothetical protein BU16DRAFT_141413 [Lophium mytilinum]|uniref:Uncharacterized protein n=1 Tax=Lophium mytilinum TaxID=390894 RepID=A0A6A6QF42_9PEZI|nr:hypothetical protein BU16DRAFT_141413 [Lophium mytilinum]